SSGTLMWGETNPTNSTPSQSAGLALSHQVDLSGLTPGTNYKIRVQAEDFFGNETTTGLQSFTTIFGDIFPPAIYDFQVVAVSDNEAVIGWFTNEETRAEVF